MPKFVQALLVPGEEGGLEVDAKGTKYMFVFCEHNARQNHILRVLKYGRGQIFGDDRYISKLHSRRNYEKFKFGGMRTAARCRIFSLPFHHL